MFKIDGIFLIFSFSFYSVTRNKFQTEDPQNQPRPSQTVHQGGYGPLGHHQLQRGSQVSVCKEVLCWSKLRQLIYLPAEISLLQTQH